jgi:hypothetical protein
MKYTIDRASNRGFCVIRVSGEHRRPDDSITLQKLASDIRSKDGCNRFLFDMSQADIKGEGIETFKVGVAPVEKGLDRNFTIALVYSGSLKEHKFMENVLVNRGYKVRVFDNVDAAIEWLTPTENNT